MRSRQTDATEDVLRRIRGGPHVVAHLSDALRLAAVHAYGGWYADIDTVIMRALTDFRQEESRLHSIMHTIKIPPGGGNLAISFHRPANSSINFRRRVSFSSRTNLMWDAVVPGTYH